jgi:hypothetical protein
VICGAVEGLKNLEPSQKNRYIDSLQEIANALTLIKDVQIKNGSTVEDKDGKEIMLRKSSFSLEEVMKKAAHEVGHHIATVPLRALRGHANGVAKDYDLQDLTTWDNEDETAAVEIADSLNAQGSATDVSKNRTKVQLLSGGILAVVREPDLYQSVNKVLLNAFAQTA